MAKRVLILILVVAGVSSQGIMATLLSAEVEKLPRIAIFSEGIQYKSMRDYKLYKLKNTYKETLLAARGDDLDEVFNHIVKGLSSGRTIELDQFEIDEIVYELKVQKSALEKSLVKSPDAIQLQEMLDQYVKDKGDQGYYKLDPDKMKTVIISSR